MNEELKAKLLEMLTQIQEAARDGGSFVIDQAPEIAREIVTLGRVQSTLATCGGLTMAIAGVITGLLFIKKYQRSDDADTADFCSGAAIFLGAIPTVLGTVMFGSCVQWCIKTWFAPRLYIIDYIRGLL